MPQCELLIMAMTHMRAGICTAGYSMDRHAQSGLAWVRPVKPFGVLLLGDMTDAEGRVVQVGDVAEIELTQHTPEPPFVEDWDGEFVRHRPRVVRRLEGNRWAAFLAAHVDRAPHEVLGDPVRSLCLVRPSKVEATFEYEPVSEDIHARLALAIDGKPVISPSGRSTLSVTDMAWRALGRTWLHDAPLHDGRAVLALTAEELQGRLGFQEVYVAIGLSRTWNGRKWPLVVGVYPIPAVQVSIDYAHP